MPKQKKIQLSLTEDEAAHIWLALWIYESESNDWERPRSVLECQAIRSKVIRAETEAGIVETNLPRPFYPSPNPTDYTVRPWSPQHAN